MPWLPRWCGAATLLLHGARRCLGRRGSEPRAEETHDSYICHYLLFML